MRFLFGKLAAVAALCVAASGASAITLQFNETTVPNKSASATISTGLFNVTLEAFDDATTPGTFFANDTNAAITGIGVLFDPERARTAGGEMIRMTFDTAVTIRSLTLWERSTGVTETFTLNGDMWTVAAGDNTAGAEERIFNVESGPSTSFDFVGTTPEGPGLRGWTLTSAVAAVPVPAGLPMLAAALGLGALLRTRKSAS